MERGRESEAAGSRPAEFVVGNEDDDEFEEPKEPRKVTAGRAPTEWQRGEYEGRTIQCTESAKCV